MFDKLHESNKQDYKNRDLYNKVDENDICLEKEKFLKYYKTHTEYIAKLSKIHNVNLNYSIESMNDVMELINSARAALERNEISEQFVSRFIMDLGVYVGDTILKNGLYLKGFKWMVPEEIKNEKIRSILDYPNNRNPFLSSSTGITNPVDKVLKYWNNGNEDNLLTYCKDTISYMASNDV